MTSGLPPKDGGGGGGGGGPSPYTTLGVRRGIESCGHEEGIPSQEVLRVRIEGHAFVAEGTSFEHLAAPGRGSLDDLDPLDRMSPQAH